MIWILRVWRRELLAQVLVLLELIQLVRRVVYLRSLKSRNRIGVYVIFVARLLWVALLLLASSFAPHTIIGHASGRGRAAGAA